MRGQIITKTYKDQQGNRYRKGTGGWEILRPGIGWQAFESTAYITVQREHDGGVETTAINPTPQTESPEIAEEKQVRKIRENELFVHFVDTYQKNQLKAIFCNQSGLEAANKNADEVFKIVSESSCDYAQAIIDEMKKRGRL